MIVNRLAWIALFSLINFANKQTSRRLLPRPNLELNERSGVMS